MDAQGARTAKRWDVTVLMLAVVLGTTLAIGAMGLRAPSARAYALLGPIWPNQPPAHNCCAQLGVVIDGAQPGYDYTGWLDGMGAWNDSPADILWNIAPISSTIYLDDTNIARDNILGYTDWGNVGPWMEYADGYLNQFYTAHLPRATIQAISTHELGHVAGLQDVSTPCVIMVGTLDISPGSTPCVTIPQQDDINRINYMY